MVFDKKSPVHNVSESKGGGQSLTAGHRIGCIMCRGCVQKVCEFAGQSNRTGQY